MSCENVSFPIDINQVNNIQFCKTKCNLECNYHTSTCNATNKETYLSLSYDVTQIPPAIFNGNSLDVKEVRIYSPSLHTYESTRVDAEIVVIHHGFNTRLAICIPVRINDKETSLLDEIIDQCSSVVPNTDESNTLRLSDYTIDNFIDYNIPFLHYSGKVPFDCGSIYDIIVLGNRSQYVSVTAAGLEVLRKIIDPVTYHVQTGKTQFFNKTGIVKKTSKLYTRCYDRKKLPGALKQKLSDEESKGKEAFSNFESIVEDQTGVHIQYLLFALLGLYGSYYFIKEVSKSNR